MRDNEAEKKEHVNRTGLQREQTEWGRIGGAVKAEEGLFRLVNYTVAKANVEEGKLNGKVTGRMMEAV